MSTQQEPFHEWLYRRVSQLGYDVSGPRSGGRRDLSRDTGMAISQVGRALNGQAIPDVNSLRRLRPVLQVTLQELMVRAGYATWEDWNDPGESAALSPELYARRVGTMIGVPKDRLDLFVRSVLALAREFSGRD